MQDFSSLSFFVIMAGFLLALVLTAWVRNALLRRSVLDIPNERSSHVNPVPRGGGWALLIIIFPALIIGAALFDFDPRHAGLIAAVFLLALISWIDDRRHVSPAMRLSMHILAACLGSFSFPPNEMIFGGSVPFWVDRTLMILEWTWFINLYNFMDGIDGITGAETVSISVGICLVSALAGIVDPFSDFVLLVLTGVCLGFLVYNWHPAKIFLGDIGSVPLGYLVGFCLLVLAVKGHLSAALILPLYYLADSGFTLTKRALRKDKIWQAHREHFYQHAAQGMGTHSKVVGFIIVANVCLIAAATFSISYPLIGFGAGVIIVGILLMKMQKAS